MKKTKIIVLMIFTFLMSCTISPINAAQVAPDSTDNGVCPIGECSEYVVAGDIVRFGMKLYGNQAYKVEKVDLSSDKVYNSIIGAWIPAYLSLIHIFFNSSGCPFAITLIPNASNSFFASILDISVIVTSYP